MQTYEYKVVPAPNRPKRIKGVKGNPARFAGVLTEAMNELAADGWEYLRSDSLPVEEKPGILKGRIENYHTVLVFRRAVAAPESDTESVPVAPVAVAAPVLTSPQITEPVGASEPFVSAPVIDPDTDETLPEEPPVSAAPSYPDDDNPFGPSDAEEDEAVREDETR